MIPGAEGGLVTARGVVRQAAEPVHLTRSAPFGPRRAREQRNMSTILRALCGAVLLTSLLTAPAMAVVWRSDLVCDPERGRLQWPGSAEAVCGDSGPRGIVRQHDLWSPPARAFTCAIDCFPVGRHPDCAVRDDRCQRHASSAADAGFLPPEVCAGISFFLFDGTLRPMRYALRRRRCDTGVKGGLDDRRER